MKYLFTKILFINMLLLCAFINSCKNPSHDPTVSFPFEYYILSAPSGTKDIYVKNNIFYI